MLTIKSSEPHKINPIPMDGAFETGQLHVPTVFNYFRSLPDDILDAADLIGASVKGVAQQ